MAPTRNQRIARLASTLDGGGNARRVSSLRQWGDQQGLFGASPGLGAPEVQGVGEQAWGGLKAVGSNVLDSLSVPQATLYTVAAKLAGRDTSWKNIAGNFRTADNGMSGTDAALNSMGITNKWARLGVSIVVDPLWFVGGTLVRAPTKAKAIAKAIEEGNDVRTGATVLQLTAGKGRKMIGAGRDPVNWTYGSRRPRSAVARLGAGRRQISAGKKDIEDAVEEIISTGRPMAVPGLPKSFMDRLVKDPIRAASVPVQRMKVTIRGNQRPSDGWLVGGRYFVKSTGRGKNKRYEIRDLGKNFDPNAPAKTRQVINGKVVKRTKESLKGMKEPASDAIRYSRTFKNSDEAIEFAEGLARHSGRRWRPRRDGSTGLTRRDVRGGRPAQQADETAGPGWTREGQPYDPDYETSATDIVLRGDSPTAVARQTNAEEVIDGEWEDLAEAVDTAADALRSAGNPEAAARIVDDYGNLTDLPSMLKKLREELSKLETREGMNYGVKVGAGKFSKTFDTGISAERGFLGRRTKTAFRAGVMGMKPVEKVAHALRRSGTESADGVTAAMLRMADEFGMTTKVGDKTVIKETDATMMGVYRSLRSVNEEAGNTLRDVLQRQGLWTEQHDQVTALIDKRNEYFKTVDNLTEDTREEDIVKAIDDLTKKRDAAAKRLELEDSRSNANKLKKAEEQLAKAEDDLRRLRARGPYTKQGRRQADLEKERKIRDEKKRMGIETGGYRYRRFKDPDVRNAERVWLDNPFQAVTEREFISDMMKAGLDKETADSLAVLISSELERAGLQTFRKSAFEHGLPEWNAFLLAGRREQDHIWHQVEEQIDELMRISGIAEDTQVGTLLKYGVNREDGSGFASTRPGELLLKSIAKFKGFLTFANPSHFTRNLAGDYTNSMINGNWSHVNPLSPFRAGYTRSRNSRMANAEAWAAEGRVDDEILKQIFVVGGKEYTGMEMLALSRMIGLGRGYVGTDVALMAEAFERARTSPGELYRFMQRLNIKRENAQRMQTWMKHMNKGDDPIEAAYKTLRVHFDYTQLTEFEKLQLRNILLFYTWMKRNLILQASSIATRPGYLSTVGDIENARPKFPNEPDYYPSQLALPVPGLGNLIYGNPAQDIAKLELGMDGFRKDVLGAVTPPIRIPVELATNQKFFSGGRIQDYEGQLEPNAIADLLGIGTPTRAKAGGEMARGINPQLAYIISQLTGPQGGTLQSVAGNPDYEGSKSAEVLGRFVGLTPQQNRPEQFARAEKYRQAKKKADATRARNAQREGR